MLTYSFIYFTNPGLWLSRTSDWVQWKLTENMAYQRDNIPHIFLKSLNGCCPCWKIHKLRKKSEGKTPQGSTQAMAWYLVASTHYQNQCWVPINDAHWRLAGGSLTEIVQDITYYKVFGNYNVQYRTDRNMIFRAVTIHQCIKIYQYTILKICILRLKIV